MSSNSLDASDRRALALRGYMDPVWFCRFFLSHIFPTEMPWFHRGILALLLRRTDFLESYGEVDQIIENFFYETEEEGERQIFYRDDDGRVQLHFRRYVLVMLPRGFAKTTIAGVAAPLINILYRDKPFTVYVSEAAPHAKMQLNNVKRELEMNQRILEIFGPQKPGLKDSQKWSEDFFETTTGCAMAARGRGGQIRGLNHLGNRPKLIICDDLEDQESVLTDLQRDKTREWAYGDLMPALPSEQMDPDAGIVALGTLLHPDALLETFAQDPEWSVVRFGAYDEDENLLWPEMFPLDELQRRKASFARAGKLHLFYLEYMNEARTPETQTFRQDYFQYGQPDEKESYVVHATYLDPAFSQRRTADESVIVTCGRTNRGRIFLREAWGKRGASEDEKCAEYFRQSKLYRSRFNGVESVAAQVAFISTLRERMFREKWYFETTPVNNKTKKTLRIPNILQPRFAAGYIVFTRRFPELEAQLLDFPNAKHDDYPDALAGCVTLLDPSAATVAGRDLTQDEYAPLDEVIGGDFRWA